MGYEIQEGRDRSGMFLLTVSIQLRDRDLADSETPLGLLRPRQR